MLRTGKLFAKLLPAVLIAVTLIACSGQGADTAQSGADQNISASEQLGQPYEEDNFVISANDKWENFEQEGTDTAFRYVGENEDELGDEVATLVGIQTSDSGGFPLSTFVDSMRKAYEGIYTVVEEGDTKVASYDSHYFKLKEEGDDSGLTLMQEFVVSDQYVYAFHITYFDSVYDKVKPEIDTLLSTFSIK